ncbi:hypothetical protein [Cellulosimicrobium funkei]|uniref:hypothetical protein n=1 Tax=Cellulosimicrobium funkei TaxID=264251 RepID=UPI0037DD8F49
MSWFDRFRRRPTISEPPKVELDVHVRPATQEERDQAMAESAQRWAGMSADERREHEAARKEKQRIDRLAQGGEVAAREQRGHVRGRHFTEWPDTIRQLKREGRVDDALELALECIEATERDARADGLEPAPAYTTMAAIIYRQRKDYAAEIAILERYRRACPPGRGSYKIDDRLAKARELKAKASG